MEIKSVLHDGLIVFNMKSTTKEEAIRELAQLLAEKGYVTGLDNYIEAVMEREKLATTGLGMGIAIPHGKCDAVTEASIVFGRSSQGINYKSEDGQPVYLMFLIAVPETSKDDHLKILAQISRKIVHKNIREALKLAGTAQEVYEILS